jgi:V/A-type H+-transporting ATPase subunit E
MGVSELKTALQHEGEVRAREFWRQSEATVDERRKEIEAELARLRAEAGRSLQAEETALRNKLLFEARAKATGCRLHAEAAMESRLLEMAGRVLLDMAGTSRRAIWLALSEELPDFEWTKLTVHPEDQEVARQTFPAAAVACAEEIGAGLVASGADGSVRIDNSLRRRLLRAWPDLLPKLIQDLRERVDRDAAARNHTTV